MREIVETEAVHFLNGLLHSPIVFSDAIGGPHGAGPVFTITTIGNIIWPGELHQENKKLSDLFTDRRSAADRNVGAAETKRFSVLPLGLDFVIPAKKIDNGGNTELFEFSEPQLVCGQRRKKSFILHALTTAASTNFYAVEETLSDAEAEDYAQALEGAPVE